MQSEASDTQAASTATAAQARFELQEYLEVSRQQHGLFPRADAMNAVAVLRQGCTD
jgi:hypothetical protein